jgi:hypothetical protein
MPLEQRHEVPDRPGIYVFEFANGKKYVGASRLSARVRVAAHINAALAGRTKMPVRAAIAKHGLEALSVSFIACEGCPLEAERALIARFRSEGAALYNATDGGEGIVGFSHAPEVKAAMSRAARNSWTNERRRKASETLRKPEVRERLSASQKRSWDNARRDAMARQLRDRSAKLDEASVLEIVRRLSEGQSCASLGRAFGVTPEAISAIKHGKNWGHVTGITRAA